MTKRWSLGEVFVLRHAGFPFDWLEGLGLSASLTAELDGLLAEESGLERSARESGGEKEARAMREALLAGQPTRLPAPLRARLGEAVEHHLARRAALEARYGEERQQLRRRLRELASEPSIQEAVFISNPTAFDNVWARFLASEGTRDNADARRAERQVYTYLQRFCAKNETTSFFGPISYGEEVAGRGDGLQVRPSGSTARRTFFSFWAVTELARAVGRERSLRGHLPLRVNPLFQREPGRAACAQLGLEVALSPEAERLLDVLASAPSLVGAAGALGLPLETVERLAVPLVRGALLLLGLPFSANAFGTFESLQSAVAALPQVPARERWVAELEALGRMKAEYQEADLARRRTLLPELEAHFTRLTGKPARRGEGQVYSDRLILYEEASSPFRLEMGAGLMRRLEEALSPALEVSAAYGERVQRVYREQVRDALGPQELPLDFLTYAVRLRPENVTGSRFSPVPPLPLEREEGSRERRVAADTLGEPAPGGRYALPDVCLAENRGPGGEVRYDVLLARVHHHLQLWSWLSAFYPDRPRYESVARRWLEAEPSARGLVGLSVRRRNKGFYVYPGARLVYAVTDVLDVEEGALGPHDVRVRVDAQGPTLVDAKGQSLQLYLPLDDFSHYAPFAAVTHPLVLHAPFRSEGEHQPRVRIGEALYQRERWEVSAAPFARAQGFSLLLAVRRAARAQGWPRFVFVRSTTERKPYLLDTLSPFAMELLRHVAHGAEQLRFEEMFPAPEQLWLRDARGRYTCEMRMQAVRWSGEQGRAAEGDT